MFCFSCFHTLIEKKEAVCLPFRATPFRRMAVMALFMSSSVSKAELTFTISKSTGTQVNLQHNVHKPHNGFNTYVTVDDM